MEYKIFCHTLRHFISIHPTTRDCFS